MTCRTILVRRLALALTAASMPALSSVSAQAAQARLWQDPYAQYLPPPPPSAPPAWQRLKLGPIGGYYLFPVHASLAMDDAKALSQVRRLVIVIHDARRDARQAYEAVTALYGPNRERMTDTLVVAPRFANPIDSEFDDSPAWRRNGWINGEPSISDARRSLEIGSFKVLDDLLQALRQRLPRLRDIVLAGHGAGGQMVQRYAVLNPVDDLLRKQGIHLSYVIANADSYLYLDHERPQDNAQGFGKYERGICPTYEHYPYGLKHLPANLGNTENVDFSVRYRQRLVTYLLGSADNNPEQHGLDKRCGAEAQGSSRLTRGMGYWKHERHDNGGRPPSTQQAYVVPDVGYDAGNMYGSVCGAMALMGPDALAAPDATVCEALTE